MTGGPSARVVLLLAASPSGTAALETSLEFDVIRDAVRLGDHRDDLVVARSQNTQATELIGELFGHDPAVLHFSGHGLEAGALAFESAGGEIAPVPVDVLAAVFEHFDESIRCVVLNACWSRAQAAAIGEHIDNVVGMTRQVTDASAISFSGTFYRALAEGKPVSEAFELGRLQVELAGGASDLATLLVRPGAGEAVLAGPLAGLSATTVDGSSPGTPEREAFVTAAFHANFGVLVRLASVLLDTLPGAEAIVKDVFIDLLYDQSCPTPDAVADHLRSRVIREARSVVNRSIAAGPATDGDDRARVMAALRGLPSPTSEVLVLEHLGSLATDEIASTLGMTTQAVADASAQGMSALGPMLDELVDPVAAS